MRQCAVVPASAPADGRSVAAVGGQSPAASRRRPSLMCGIAGIVRRAPIGVSPDLLARMAAAMRHRGPDGFGVYAGARAGLAHVRLSIIDLSGGAQPLANEDGSLLVVFNGEIYNFVELR